MVRGHGGGTDQSSGLQHDDRGGGRQQKRFAFAALASLCAQHESGGQRRIDHHDFERQAVHAGHRGDVGERDVVDLRDAQQVPGKSGDASARQFHRDPGERGQKKSPAIERIRSIAFGRARQKADQQAKDAVIDSKIEAEKKQQPGGGERTHAPVLAHGVVDPVASSGIPEDAAGISQKKSLTRLCRQQLDSCQKLQSVGLAGPQKRDQQGSNGHPAQKIQIGQREDQYLQAGRKQGQQPRALMDSQHAASITKVGLRTSDFGPQTSDLRPSASNPRVLTSSLALLHTGFESEV